jgi:hypothetical protein
MELAFGLYMALFFVGDPPPSLERVSHIGYFRKR